MPDSYKFKLKDEDYQGKLGPSFAIPNQKVHAELVSRLGVISGSTVLDLGCGSGASIPNLLQAVGANGKAIGYDINEDFLAITERIFQEEIKAQRLKLVLGKASNHLPFADNSFDSILCHNVIECVTDKVALINEIHRILKPRGSLVLSHYDFDTGIYNSSYKELTRELIHYYADYIQGWQEVSDGQIGRKLRGLVASSGFRDFQAETLVFSEEKYAKNNYGFRYSEWLIAIAKKNNKFKQTDLENWINDLIQKDRDNSYYFAICLMIVTARK